MLLLFSLSVVSNSLQPHGGSSVHGILQARILDCILGKTNGDTFSLQVSEMAEAKENLMRAVLVRIVRA